MRLINFAVARKVRVGVEDSGDIVDLVTALGGERGVKKEDRAILADTVSLIAAGPYGMRLARRALRESRKTGKGRLVNRGIKLRAPLAPPIILCSGENYWDHREENPTSMVGSRSSLSKRRKAPSARRIEYGSAVR